MPHFIPKQTRAEIHCRLSRAAGYYLVGLRPIALEWYRKAAAQGHNSGLCDVGFSYRNGLGVAQDFAAALPFYRRACAQGCPTAAYWLGIAYERGEGIPADKAEALKYYRLSAKRGDSDAPKDVQRLSASLP